MPNWRTRERWEWEKFRVCPLCKINKPLAVFHLRSRDRDRGRQITHCYACYECVNSRRRAQRHDKPFETYVDGLPPGWLPVEPIREWLKEKRKHYSWLELQQLTGTNERILYRLTFQTKARVSLDLVDTILTNAGVGLWELYPD